MQLLEPPAGAVVRRRVGDQPSAEALPEPERREVEPKEAGGRMLHALDAGLWSLDVVALPDLGELGRGSMQAREYGYSC